MFGVSRQSIYQSEQRITLREQELEVVKKLVVKVRMTMPRLGTRKLYYLLKKEFDSERIKIGRDALFDYLRRESMLIKPKKNYTKTTNSKHWLKKYPNLMKDKKATRIEQYFVSDITYIKSYERTHYLSLVTDAYSRKIMGYHLSNNMNVENVVKAMNMAIKKRRTNYNLIHHSDRGLQYCAYMYQDKLRKHHIQTSMTDGYDCYQNALAERINGILKQEFLCYKTKNKQELQKLIEQAIQVYNNKRPHLGLNYKTPNFIHNKNAEHFKSSAL